jgi:hypothetical protein
VDAPAVEHLYYTNNCWQMVNTAPHTVNIPALHKILFKVASYKNVEP